MGVDGWGGVAGWVGWGFWVGRGEAWGACVNDSGQHAHAARFDAKPSAPPPPGCPAQDMRVTPEELFEEDQMQATVRAVLQELDEREAGIVRMRLGIDGSEVGGGPPACTAACMACGRLCPHGCALVAEKWAGVQVGWGERDWGERERRGAQACALSLRRCAAGAQHRPASALHGLAHGCGCTH